MKPKKYKYPNCEKGAQSQAQKKIEAKIKSMGGNYILVRSLEDFKEQMNAFL